MSNEKKPLRHKIESWDEHLRAVLKLINDDNKFAISSIVEWVTINLIISLNGAIKNGQGRKGNKIKWTEDQKLNLLAKVWSAFDHAIKPVLNNALDDNFKSFNIDLNAIAQAWGLIEDGQCIEMENIEHEGGLSGIGITRGAGMKKSEFEGLSDREQDLLKDLALNNQSAEA